jgi:hypothetical protein
MKYFHAQALLLLFVFYVSCGRGNKPGTPKENSTRETGNMFTTLGADEKYLHTKYEYTDSTGKRLIIQNSLSKGGMRYTDANGKVYVYVVFWSRIINETDTTLEFKIDFPLNSYELPSLRGKYFNISIAPDTMTLDREHLFDHGLTDIKSLLDRSIHKPSSLKRSINPKGSTGFYVVLLSPVGSANGTIRTGLSLKGEDLFYRINVDGSRSNGQSSDKEIHCGSIGLKKFGLRG